jgi:protein CpxP
MNASLLCRPAFVLALAIPLIGGIGMAAVAQTTATPAAPPAANAPSTSATPSSPNSGNAAPPTTASHNPGERARIAGPTMEQMAEQRINNLHSRLHITAAQQSQWDQFAQAMQDGAKALDQAYQQRAANFNTMNAVENMQSYAQIEQIRAEGAQKLVPAFQTLYASFSDEQKRDADAVFRNQTARTEQRTAHAKH